MPYTELSEWIHLFHCPLLRKGQQVLPLSWEVGSAALQIQGKLDISQASKQGLHMVSLGQLGFGESVDPHLQLKGNTSASART